MTGWTPQSDGMTTALIDTDRTTAARIEAARDSITADELSEMFALALATDPAPAEFRPYLPPRTTEITGWGAEADRHVNLHGQSVG